VPGSGETFVISFLFSLFSKHIHDVDILPFLQGAIGLLQKLENYGEFRYINLSIRYIMEAVRISNKDKFLTP
jgi:hypothetical protein